MRDWRPRHPGHSHHIASTETPDLRLHLRARSGSGTGGPVLFVHGATFSSRLYDIPHADVNWLDAAAEAGFDAYALDIRGYGLSRPDVLPTDGEPYAQGDMAVSDIGDAVDWISARHGGAPVALVGWSWGSITTARYVLETAGASVSKLVLYAPIFAERNEAWLSILSDPDRPEQCRNWPPFRRVDLEETRLRWDAQLPAGADWRMESVLQALVKACLSDDPQADETSPPSFCVPNGTFLDLWEAFNGRPLYQPEHITCPVLLIRGTQDPTSTRSDALALFDRLGARDRQYIEIANGTHFINAETQAAQLFASVHGFLSGTKS